MARKADVGMFVPEAEQPYKIPYNWRWVRLGLPATIIMGQSPDGDSTTDDKTFLPLIGGAADMGELYPNATRYTKKPTKISAKGDVILCVRATLGRPIYSDGSYCLGRGVAAIRPNVGDEKFYRYALICFEQYLLDRATGSTFAQISSSVLKNMPIPLPPLAEQQRIVDRIESLFTKLDAARDNAQAVVDGFETRKAAILYRAFSGELSATWREDNGISLDSWLQLGFNSCVEKMQNGLAKRKGTAGNPVVVLRLANLSDDGFLTDDLREIVLDEKEQSSYLLHSGDILMIRVNGSKENVGKQFLITNQNAWAFCDHIIRVKCSQNIQPEYMTFFSKSETYKQYVKSHIVSSAGQNTISRRAMTDLLIPVPTMEEQGEIVRLLNGILEKEQETKETAQQVIDNIDAMKKAILGRAFRGELGTNDPSEASPERTIIGG